MEIRFDQQVVLITGASTGIGASLAGAFGAAGAKVVVHYNSSEAAAETVAAGIEAAGGEGQGLIEVDLQKQEVAQPPLLAVN